MMRIALNIVKLSMTLLLIAGLLAMGGGDPPAEEEPPAGRDQPPPPQRGELEPPTDVIQPRRVVVRENRNREIAGYVELEDGEVIVVRDREGKLHSFAKTRVNQIIYLNDPLPGQSGVVVLRNGQVRRGVIVEDGFDHVVIEIEGIRTRLKREDVDYVLMQPTVRERYRRFKATITPDTPDRHLDLCRWLVDEGAYELAESELKELLSNQPLPEARDLLRVAQAHLALRASAGRSEQVQPPGESDPPRPESPPESEQQSADRIISADEVNIIRVYEINFQRPPRVAIPKRTIERLIERYGTNSLMPASREEREALFRKDPIDIVKLMFDLRARDLYGEIEVLSEPYALNQFRQRVHNTWLMNSCSTSRCHGGDRGGDRFSLHRRNYKDPRVRYTNLLILERLEIDPEWPLINYDNPMESLIIQYALPRDQARKPHPDVRGWSPALRRPDDRVARDAVEWIKSMYQPRPDYPVQYEPPRVEKPEATTPVGR